MAKTSVSGKQLMRESHSQSCTVHSLHHTETRTVHHRYRIRATWPIHFSAWNIPWAILLAVLLVETIATAEETTKPLDFGRPPLHETAELLTFLVGLYAFVLTLFSILGALVADGLRRQRRAHHATSHRHGLGKEKADIPPVIRE
jgi:hypothetical protein